jgi:hypothetical protein
MTLLYGTECRAIKVADMKRIELGGMRYLRTVKDCVRLGHIGIKISRKN